MQMLPMRSARCPACQATIPVDALVCPACGAQVAMDLEDLRIARSFLLIVGYSIVGGIAAFTGAMSWVGIGETYRIVVGAWGFTILVLLGLAWLVNLLAGGTQGMGVKSDRERTSAVTRTTQRRYDRQAAFYDVLELPVEFFVLRPLRSQLWAEVRGSTVLEIGVGTGKNLPYHPRAGRLVALDLSPRMLHRAASRARRSGRRIDFVLADAQHLPFRSGVFDDAAATFVFCSVPDPIAGLSETRRVVSSAGTIHLLEHVRSGLPVLGRLMDLLNPLAVRLTGANINRNTMANVERSAIALDTVESRGLGIITLMRGAVRRRLETQGAAR